MQVIEVRRFGGPEEPSRSTGRIPSPGPGRSW
jgi:hypothetical protein